MLLDFVYGAVILLAGGWVFVWIVAGTFTTMRDAKREAYQSQFCPTCHAEFKSQAWLDDLSGQMGERLIKRRYCPNGHSWIAARHIVGSGESPIDRLGGWAP